VRLPTKTVAGAGTRASRTTTTRRWRRRRGRRRNRQSTTPLLPPLDCRQSRRRKVDSSMNDEWPSGIWPAFPASFSSDIEFPAPTVARMWPCETVNPYLSTIRHVLDQVENETIPVAVKLRHFPAGKELAAIINTQNLSTIHLRKVVFFRYGADAPRYVDILSRHYESF
jgi:hypothetical protein